MSTGTVKFFNPTKGFGFIKNNESQSDIFVHISGLADRATTLEEGDRVSYDVTDSKKGQTAVNVTKI